MSLTRRGFLAALAAFGLAARTPPPPPVLDSAGFPVLDEAGNMIRQQ